EGTGNEGRVTKKDILQYVQNRSEQVGKLERPKEELRNERAEVKTANRSQPPVSNGQTANANTQTSTQQREPETSNQQPETTYGDNVEVIEMDRMRKLIAKHMINSKQTSAHVTSFAEADVTNMVLWREKNKKDFE